MERRIVHINFTNFMAAIEALRAPDLVGWPFVIAAENQARCTLLAVSDTAYCEGLRPGLPLSLARKRVAALRVIPPDGARYEQAQRAIYQIACRFSPLVELRGNGHLFVDMTGTRRLFGHATDAAAQLKEAFQSHLSLDPTTALAANKIVSKVATRVVRPHGFAAIPPGEESHFMAPQEVTLLPGIGPTLSRRMGALGITIMGELAALSGHQALTAFGAHAPRLQQHARGEDSEPVLYAPRGQRSLSFSRTLPTDCNAPLQLAAHLALLTEEMGLALRAQNQSAGRMQLTLHFSDAKTCTRQTRLTPPLYLDQELYTTAKALLDRALQRRVRVRRCALTLSHLSHELQQLDLFALPPETGVQKALDTLRKRYGRGVVQRASTLPLLPLPQG